MKRQTFYYTEKMTEDFGSTVKNIRPLPKEYLYINDSFAHRVFSFFIYYLVAKPIFFIYVKLRFHHRFKNRQVLKTVKGGYFLYGNHTMLVGDAVLPSLIRYKTKNYVITGPAANSLTGILPLLNALGIIPLTESPAQNVKMYRCIKKRLSQNAAVTVYPEAHVWPFYNGVRPFGEDSFEYPAMMDAPVFALTSCFQRRKLSKTPKVLSYIDGPFYPKKELSHRENARYLRDEVYRAMCRRTETYSTYSPHSYIKQEPEA